MVKSIQFTPVFVAAILFFIWSCKNKFALMKLGTADNRFDRSSDRIKAAFTYAIGQKRVVKGPFGINHAILFWSFLVLVVLNLEFMVNGIIPAVSFRILPDILLYPLKGVFDIVSLLVIIAVSAAGIRKIVNPLYPESRTFEAFFILSLIGTLMVAYFGLNGAEIALGQYTASSLTPVSTFTASLYSGMTPDAIHSAGVVFWWIHAFALLGFMNFLPYSKHMHVLTAIPNCYFKPLEKPVLPEREVFKKGETFGVDRIDGMSWKDLFDSYTCTECGRCQDICPATNTEKPLNPRTLIHSIKENLIGNSADLKSGNAPSMPLIQCEGKGSVSEDEIWACVTCGACMEACPVFIEHIPKTIKMRRHLVETEAKFPEELLNLFENMEQRSNPWGIAPADRTKWTSLLDDVKEYESGKTEYLFFVGCAGAFDSRSKQVTLALASIMDNAGISWGILGKDELCCGDSVRRLGNEYLFEQMALKNVEMFKEKGVKKIVTQCPHCFTTLLNDYKQYGIELEVIHHSKLISDLIDNGQLKMNGAGKDFGDITFHDSCYIGRHNSIYTEPRNVLSNATGKPIKEMEQKLDKSFCCGAGGGRMWLEEDLGTRMNVNRVQQAVDTDADTVCTSCPYCLTMFEDGIKDVEAEKLRVYDIAEVVAESMIKGK